MYKSAVDKRILMSTPFQKTKDISLKFETVYEVMWRRGMKIPVGVFNSRPFSHVIHFFKVFGFLSS
jgi:hypothetical protein